MGSPPKHWRLRVSLAWIGSTALGTLAAAPVFGVFIGLVGAVAGNGLDAVVDGALIGVFLGVLWIAVPAAVLAAITAMLVTRPTTDVNSRRYSLRVRRRVAVVLGLASVPLTVMMARGANRPFGIALALLPVFVVATSLTVGLAPVMYTREVFDPATAADPSVLRRTRHVRAEARFDALLPRIADLFASGADDRQIGALVTYEARLDYDEAVQRVAELRRAATNAVPPAG